MLAVDVPRRMFGVAAAVNLAFMVVTALPDTLVMRRFFGLGAENSLASWWPIGSRRSSTRLGLSHLSVLDPGAGCEITKPSRPVPSDRSGRWCGCMSSRSIPRESPSICAFWF